MKALRVAAQMAMVLLTGILPMAAQSNWSVTKTFPVGGDGGWDYVTVDSPGHRLFVTRSTHTMVIDSDSGKVLGDIQGQKRSHGVAIVPRVNRGFITDGEGASIVVFDLKTYAVLGKIAAVDDVDGAIYDAKQDRVLVAAGDSATLLSFKPDIDLHTGKPDSIPLGGKPEFLAADGQGRAFVNLQDKNVIAVVSLAAGQVVARWPVAPAGSPVGLALTRDHKLVIGCRNPAKMLVMDADTGKIEAQLPIPGGVDADAADGSEIFASTGDGTLTIAAAQGGAFSVVQSVKTAPGSRTMGLDAATHSVYLPAAEMEPAANGGRPKPKPGSFKILVVQHP